MKEPVGARCPKDTYRRAIIMARRASGCLPVEHPWPGGFEHDTAVGTCVATDRARTASEEVF